MAFVAAFAVAAAEHVMLENERPCLLSVTCNAGVLAWSNPLVGFFVGMQIVAIATDHPAFRHRMVEVMAELAHLFPVASSAG